MDIPYLLKMDDEEPPQPPPLPQQPSQPPRPHRRGPKITIHHSSFVPMPQTQRPNGQPDVDPPADPNLPDFDYTVDDISDPNVKILVDRHGRYVISYYAKGFLPNRLVSESITAVIEARYQKPWLSWGAIKAEGKNMVNNKPRDEFWNLFKEKCTWKKEEDDEISKHFDSACSKRLSSMLSDARKKRGPKDENCPNWIGEGTWRELCKKWDLPEYKDKCRKNKDNRGSEKATTSTHSGGSVNAGTCSFRYKAQHGRLPTILETFNYFHFQNGVPLDSRSESINKEMKEFIEAFKRQQDSLPPSERADTITANEIINNKFIEIAGGKNKGRIVGAGSNSSLYQKGPSGTFIDTSRNSYSSTGRSARRHDDPIYTEVEQLRAENARLKAQQEELVKSQQEMERSIESRVVELVQRTMQEQHRQSRRDTSQHDPHDYETTPQYDDFGTSMVRYIMPQPNNRSRLQPQFVRSDHDEHQRPHIPVSDRQPSSSTRTVFNGADFNIPEGESFLRNFNSYMDNASQENPQNMGRGGNRSGGRSGSNLPQYYDN